MKPSFLSVPMVVAGICLVSAMPAQAEYFGLVNGRSADVANAPRFSVEAGTVLGDLYNASFQHFGARLNFRASPQIMLYGDIGHSEVEDADGISYGLGAYYQINGVLKTTDLAVKGSYHKAGLDLRNFDVDFSVLVIEALFSGHNRLGTRENIGWYASLGIHRFDTDNVGSKSETELGVGAGATMSLAIGELYGGINLIDELTFGAGYRFFLN